MCQRLIGRAVEIDSFFVLKGGKTFAHKKGHSFEQPFSMFGCGSRI